jgi:cob(I)alamin adenosyltransferase
MGDGFTWDTKKPRTGHQDRARDVGALRREIALGDYDMLVFDELVYVLSYNMLPVAEVLEEIRTIRASQPALHIVVTGRDAPPIDRSRRSRDGDEEIKHPFTAGIRAQQGIEF